MAGDNRGSSSLFRRAEQLRRWQESETNKQDIIDRPKKRKVKFSDGCIFLAAGAAGDKDELKRLLDRGADINTVNQDGITALHAACIDNNLEIVEFLVDSGADINRCDMEGWTPLHATASCGSVSMAEFLISRGADLSVVNNDGELAIDVVDEDDMAKLLQEEMDKRGIDCDASRSREERRMLEDAQSWLNSGQLLDNPHPKTGATALHVAAAKGYMKVMRLLLEAGADVDTKDFDGWTPLHAAAHWGQSEAVEILCDHMADLDSVNNVGQTPYDLADDSLESLKPLMDELRRKQASAKLINQNKVMSKKRKPSPTKDRSYKKEKESNKSSSSSSDEKRISGKVESSVDLSEVQSWRRPSLRTKFLNEEKSIKEDGVRNMGTVHTTTASSPNTVTTTVTTPVEMNYKENDVVLRKNSSTVKDERNCQQHILKVSANHVTTPSSTSTTASTSPTRQVNSSSPLTPNGGLVTVPHPSKKSLSSPSSPTPTITISNSAAETPTTPEGSSIQQSLSKLSAGSVIKNFFNLLHSSRSFAPPSRDEESETQRKAHAKMVRSTRRSTQGITLEDLKSAEQYMKNKTSTSTATTATSTVSSSSSNSTSALSATTPSASATVEIINSDSTAPSNSNLDITTSSNAASNQDSSFCLENVRHKAKDRAGDNDAATNASQPVTNVSISLKKKSTQEEKKVEEKPSEDKSSTTREGTQAVIQRRKKAKRRSTGVVHVDLDEIDPDRKSEKRSDDDEGAVDDVSASERDNTSKSSSHLSRSGSSRGSGHNGDIDYKKLYEEQLAENDKLMERLRDYERELRHAREVIENNSKTATVRSSLAESERREKRALERKLSEMEEELRQLQKLKAENEKLRAENRALTRVVSKLTNSAAGSMSGGQLSSLSRPK